MSTALGMGREFFDKRGHRHHIKPIPSSRHHLTLGDPSWSNDAVRAETDLLEISTELGQLPQIMTPGPIETAKCVRETVVPAATAAMKHIADAIELL